MTLTFNDIRTIVKIVKNLDKFSATDTPQEVIGKVIPDPKDEQIIEPQP
jgi:hypothetical protein